MVLRFVLGKGNVKARQRYEDTSRSITRNIALRIADDEFDNIKRTIAQQIENDVRNELIHLAMLFRRHITGAAGSRNRPAGMLDTVSKGEGAPRQSIATGLPPWARRNREYLRQKMAATGRNDWFNNRGWRSGGRDARFSGRVARRGAGPADAGLLFDSMRADTWETMFGPISARVFRRNRNSTAPIEGRLTTATGTHTHIQIASIQVRALGRVTFAMLPGLTRTGGSLMARASGNPALMSVVGAYDPRLAYRLGTMRNGIYRPTLEPFLAFFLTKSLSFAVSQRIRKGTLGSIIRA